VRPPSRQYPHARARIGVAALLAAGVLAACGGGPSLATFKSAFKADKARFHQLSLDLQQAIGTAGSKSNAQLASELSALSARADKQASELASLNPPAKYKAELDKLVAGFRGIATDLKQISGAAVKRNAQQATTATRQLVVDATKVRAADDGLSALLGLPPQN
jgi:hypothetical protein